MQVRACRSWVSKAPELCLPLANRPKEPTRTGLSWAGLPAEGARQHMQQLGSGPGEQSRAGGQGEGCVLPDPGCAVASCLLPPLLLTPLSHCSFCRQGTNHRARALVWGGSTSGQGELAPRPPPRHALQAGSGCGALWGVCGAGKTWRSCLETCPCPQCWAGAGAGAGVCAQASYPSACPPGSDAAANDTNSDYCLKLVTMQSCSPIASRPPCLGALSGL